ncbi:LysR family transcriptional regulator [Sphingomonas sinipercae]|uniref:LysR family transcriptional regulator n=1 Tax=Sphingomonas sinipercae TaxID=2714944 RepID=A0A6G7ZPM7_9SPHN|nr:LysR substrate-binding domain-containing protein [Sphingomonas sinipercae]QIL02885.1 LysR family transcriptional regulator [Sphingomonas sinipercae]
MRKLPPLTAVRAFEAAARNENFTAAAAELGMTQAAVSYQVKALEERIGTALFLRERGRARLTPLGARLLPTLSQAFDAIEAAFVSYEAEDESLLTVTTTTTFGNTWLAWRLGGFQMKHPDLAVRLSTGDELIDIRSGDADVAIRAGSGNWEGLECHRLFPTTFTPMATPECIASIERKLGRKIQPADVADQELINRGDEWWRQWFTDNQVDFDEQVHRRPGVRLDNQANEGHAAMAGQGFALLTPLLWVGDVAAGRLAAPFPDRLSTRHWSYWLVFPPERRMVPKVKRFREWLQAEMAAAEADLRLPESN